MRYNQVSYYSGSAGQHNFIQGVTRSVKNFLETQMGREVDITCEGATVSGRIVRIDGDVLHVEKDGVICYVSIPRIVVIWEQREKKVQSPGFANRS
jgi:hypothetical protein